MEIRQYENGIPILGTAINIPDEALPPGVDPRNVSYMMPPNVSAGIPNNMAHMNNLANQVMNNNPFGMF